MSLDPERERTRSIPNVLHFFDLSEPRNITQMTFGLANPAFLISLANNEEYVVKFLQNQTPISVDNEVAIQGQLRQANVPGIYYLRNKQDRYLYQHDSSFAVVSRRVIGVHPEQGEVATCVTMGEALAHFHGVAKGIPHPEPAWLSRHRVATALPRLREHSLGTEIQKLTAVAEELYGQGLPEGIIHGDLCTSNILVDNEDPTKMKAIFDFEEAERNLLLIDIARTAWDICIPEAGAALDRRLLAAFLDGYSTVRKLEDGERRNLGKALQYTTGAMLIWFIENGYPDRTGQILSQWQKSEKEI
jgi:Ser/Thr protein kinase RdoA (MazF antagonist)